MDNLLRPIETAIENLAAATARAALEQRDARSAEAAIASGTKAVEQSPVLWELRLVAAAGGSGFGLERAWRACQEVLGEDALLLATSYRKLHQGEF